LRKIPHLCHLTQLFSSVSFAGIGLIGEHARVDHRVPDAREGAHIIGYVWAEDEATAILSAVQRFGLVGQEASLEAHLVTPP
jgi:hypothetical protein